MSHLHNSSRQYYYLFKLRGLIRRYIVLYFLPKKSLLLPTYYEIRGLVGSQNGANIHMSVPTSLQYLATNLYTSVVDLISVGSWNPPFTYSIEARDRHSSLYAYSYTGPLVPLSDHFPETASISNRFNSLPDCIQCGDFINYILCP